VTAGFFIAGRLPGGRVMPYWASQLVGALLASGVLRLALGSHAHMGATLPAGTDVQSFVLETALTAILMFVILCVSSGSKEVGVMAGIAIGGVVGLEAMFAGPICGASMNPFRSLAPAIMSGQFGSLWVYLAGPLLGAAIAVPVWQLTRDKANDSR